MSIYQIRYLTVLYCHHGNLLQIPALLFWSVLVEVKCLFQYIFYLVLLNWCIIYTLALPSLLWLSPIKEMLSSCIMGCVGSSSFGALSSILRTKRIVSSVSPASILTFLLFLSQVSPLYKYKNKWRRSLVNFVLSAPGVSGGDLEHLKAWQWLNITFSEFRFSTDFWKSHKKNSCCNYLPLLKWLTE